MGEGPKSATLSEIQASNQPLFMTGIAAPQLLEPVVTTTQGPVIFVTDWVLPVIVLMIILRWVELCRFNNLSNNRFFEGLGLLQEFP